MKLSNIYFSILFVILTFTSFSKQIDSNFATTIATKFIQQNQTTLKRSSISLKLHHTFSHNSVVGKNKRTKTTNSFYIFNFSDNKGFIIVSADDKVLPILGYSFDESFDIDKAPANVLGWLKKYDDEITKIINENSILIHPEWDKLISNTNNLKRGAISQIAPLLKTTWNQNPIYNDSCPKDVLTNSLSVTGCVATAMAQTMKYWNYPSKGMGSNQYTLSSIGTLKANFTKSVYRWNDMPASISSTSPTYSKSAVAQLMRDCGYSVNMQYSSEGSGAWVFGRDTPTAEYALINNFGYSSSMTSLQKTDFTDTDWINKLKIEFDQARVVIYVGYTSDYISGHCFLADGYDANNLIHFNWGWGGYANGYFAITNLSPISNYNFSTAQGAIMGIKPPTCNDGIIGNDMTCVGSYNSFTTAYFGGTWSSSDVSVAEVSSEGILHTIKEGNIVLSYVLPSGTVCSDSSFSKKISILGNPQRPTKIIGDSTLCQLETKKYTTDVVKGGSWSTYSTNINVFDDGNVVGISTGKALLTYNYGNVCYHDTINKWINVKATPVIPIIKGSDSLCINASAQYSNTLTGGTWSVSDNLSSVSTSGLLKSLTQGISTLVYSKKGTTGCIGKATKTIKIKGLPMPLIQGYDSLCFNSSALYAASISKGTWAVTNSMITTTSSGNVTAKSVGTSGLKYTVSVNGCSNSVIKQIIVKSLPNVGTLSGATSFCGTLTTTLIPSVKGGIWTVSNNPIFSINQNGVVASNNTVNSTALVTYSMKLKNCTNSVTKSISVTTLPNVIITGLDSLNVNQQYTYKSSLMGGLWSVLDNRIKVTSTGVVTGLLLSSSSSLKYVYNGSGACIGKNTSCIKLIKVVTPSRIVLARQGELTVYPNPTSGLINLPDHSEFIRAFLVDLDGRIVDDEQLNEGVSSLDFTHVIPGKYLLFITHKDNQISKTEILIER